ncbi:MAG TPA: dihydrofolate reductase [Pseudomonadales bacterium]|nr:dihydrofolate reductase [Pseudomonadales bacterium]
MPVIALIAAMANNRVIGRDNQLPWHIAEDLRFFKRMTLGKPLIMGRNTFESLGRPLPGRPHIVISRNPDYQPAGVERAATLEAAIARATELARASSADEIMVIGGAQVYAAALPYARRIYLTLVDAEVAGDTHFPAIDSALWREGSRTAAQARQAHEPDYCFAVLERNEAGLSEPN